MSEPVAIEWKEGRDLTGGVLGLVLKAWEAERQSPATTHGLAKDKKAGLTPEQKALKKHIDGTSMGGRSFFAWFGFVGRHVTAEESAEANALEIRKREARKAGKRPEEDEVGRDAGAEAESEEEDEDSDMSLEIFPDGDDLAIAISEDLWPGAIKFFSKCTTFNFHLVWGQPCQQQSSTGTRTGRPLRRRLRIRRRRRRGRRRESVPFSSRGFRCSRGRPAKKEAKVFIGLHRSALDKLKLPTKKKQRSS